MKKSFFRKGEFDKDKLYIYFSLNALVILLLIVTSIFNINGRIVVYVLLVILMLLLILCIYLLVEFVILIPNTTACLTNICIGSGLLLSLILATYANLYLQVYQLKGDKAFAFTGKHLSGDDFLYYSITTFTTTGYGDITSIGLISNALAASEMLVGMISNTILMAVLTSRLLKTLKN